MPTAFMTPTTHQTERVAAPAVTREPKTTLQQIVIVSESGHDLSWLSKLKAQQFEPILLASNYDAVERLNADHELRLVLFAQRSAMMDGIGACQLLRQSRSEADVAVILLLDEKVEESIFEAFAAGASDVVCQPYRTAELIARLDAAWQRLLLWNDVETNESTAGSDAETSVTIRGAECNQRRPHFGVPKRKQESTPAPSAEVELPAMPTPAVVREVVAKPQPETSPPDVRLLLGDWLLTHDLPHGIKPPALDLSQLKFVSTLPARQMEAARQRGELNEVLLDRVWVCPQCRALPSFRPACPCCGSAGVERDRQLHHFACAFVGATSEFQVSGEGLSCPKCCTQRLMVGTDCEFLDGPWRCPDCDWNTAELEIVGHCLKCGFRFPAQQAVLEDLVGHHVV